MVEDGDYREDLLYRLNGVTIELPPLRDRLSDVPALIRFFLAQAKVEFNKPDLEGLSPEAVDLLTVYDWPGNVRQLRAVIRRCVLDTVMPVITPDTLPDAIAGSRHSGAKSESDKTDKLENEAPGSQLPQLVQRLLKEKSTNVYGESMEYMERFVILQVLQATDGNQSQAAEILGITRGKLRDRINSYNIVLKSDVAVES
jgi:two-component system nitrogen regulation response regulator GlnG